jgi:hypothetical protein
LAAIQWRRVVASARTEAKQLAPDRYAEVRYERFIASPHDTLSELSRFCELPPSASAAEFLRTRVELRDMNFQWSERFSPDLLKGLNELLGEMLSELDYGIDPPSAPSRGPSVTRPLVA